MKFTDEQKLVMGRFYYYRRKAGKEINPMFEEFVQFYLENEKKENK